MRRPCRPGGRSAAQLPVYAARFVALGAEHVEPAELFDALAELNVRSAPRHIGGDCDHPFFARVGDDVGLLLVELGV